MPITFDEQSTETIPSVKLRTVGASATFHIVDIEEVAVFDDDTKQQKVSAKGWKHVQKRFTGVLKAHDDGAKLGTVQEPGEPVDGEVYTFYSAVGGYFKWKETVEEFVEKHGRQVGVGDVVRWTLDKVDKPIKAGYSGQRHTSYQVRPAKDDESGTVARCEELYHQRKNPIALTDETPAPAYDPAEEPF